MGRMDPYNIVQKRSDGEGKKFEPLLFESVLNSLAAAPYFFLGTLTVVPFR